jgi:hypothetical protein
MIPVRAPWRTKIEKRVMTITSHWLGSGEKEGRRIESE